MKGQERYNLDGPVQIGQEIRGSSGVVGGSPPAAAQARSGPGRSQKYYTGRNEEDWTGHRFRLGKNKEVSDAELDALVQVPKIYENRREASR